MQREGQNRRTTTHPVKTYHFHTFNDNFTNFTWWSVTWYTWRNIASFWYWYCFFLNYPIVILTTCPLSFLGDLATSLWPNEIQHSWKETRHMPLRNCWFPVNYMFQLKQQRVQKQLSNLVSFSFFNNPNHTPLLSNKKNIVSFRTNAIPSQKYSSCKLRNMSFDPCRLSDSFKRCSMPFTPNILSNFT